MRATRTASKPFAVLLAASALAAFAMAASGAFAGPDPAGRAKTQRDYWHQRYAAEHKLRKRVERNQGRRVRALRADLRGDRALVAAANRALRARRIAEARTPSSLEALRLASIAYGQSYTDMLRVAECESPGLDPGLVNAEPVGREHATGLGQFLPSTFASTPYSGENILSPYANALAMGWMWSHGRRNEWACK